MSGSSSAVHLAPGLGAPGTVREHHEHHELGFLRKYVFSTDHKVIGIQFMFTGMLLFLVGGLLAMAIRYQLAWPFEPMPVLGRILFPKTGGAVTPHTVCVRNCEPPPAEPGHQLSGGKDAPLQR